MVLDVQSEGPRGRSQIRKVVVAGKTVILVEMRVVKCVRIESVGFIVQPTHAEEQFVTYNRRAHAEPITLASIAARADLCESARLIPGLCRKDVDHTPHRISAI